MITVRVDEKSQRATIKELRNYVKQTGENLKDVINRAGAAIENRAKLGTPVKTGRLRSSIHFEVKNDKSHTYNDNLGNTFDGNLGLPLRELEVVVGTNVTYAPKIEKRYGFLTRAFEDVYDSIIKGVRFATDPDNKSNFRFVRNGFKGFGK